MMRRESVCLVAFVISIGYSASFAQAEIRWLGGPGPVAVSQASQDLGPALRQLADRDDARHVVVQFSAPLADSQRAKLREAGMSLLSYLGDNAYFASLSAERLDPDAIVNLGVLSSVSAVDSSTKLHPAFAAGDPPAWSIVSPIEKDGGELVVAAYVAFHQDVSLVPDAERLCITYGATIRSRLDSIGVRVIELPFAAIQPLAGEDAVSWIEPPLPKFSGVNDDNRLRTGADTVQAPPYSLDGSGVTVLVYDGGTALASHGDFGGRLTARDGSGVADHATHVSGTIGGDGSGSGGTYRGMAPGVIIESYGFEYDGSGTFLYTNPGDIYADYDEAINTYGADISNNSIGTNTEPNGFDCAFQGDYGITSAVIDDIVRGGLGAPFRIVWANGNERQGSRCDVEGYGDYYSTAPPACAKNHITVGALNSNDDSVTTFTSWGPTDDGRIKPDISGPGCQSNGDAGVTSTSSSGGYTVKCGTSMASPTVCGLSALLLQDYRAQYPAEPDFRNSTLKTLLAHSAADVQNPGPDYMTGYGSVRIQAAIDLMRSGNFLEDTVSQGGVFSVLVLVSAGDPELKVTLAWDDVPGTPNVSPSLVNDLDLEVFDGVSTRYYPWTLDPLNPSANAVRTQGDHLNNIEQVVIDAPTPGVYRIDVRGFNVPSGPQPFSLTATPLLVACSSAGVISIDPSSYACGGGTATVRVVDCDLNTSNSTIETVSVSVVSTSEPGGESVLLTETAAETAAFEGTLPLSTTDGAGVLLIADGDVVTAGYFDLDDGMGGTNIIVTANASVDCQPPVISAVASSNIQPRSATLTFDTDEPATGIVHFGADCLTLTSTATEGGYGTSHTFNLTGLTDSTPYFYSVEAADPAGNAASDDNGGSCYTFVTPEVPDYFTEQFGGDRDLDNTSILFAPNGLLDFYAACAEPIIALPTDPTGGNVLTLTDDSSSLVTLAGGSVWLYGASYGSFYVGSNGYVTFGVGDSTWAESPSAHFSLPRISGLFDDLNPGAGGSVVWQEFGDRAVVTWVNVPEYSTTNANTFQIEMYFNGNIRISHLTAAALDGIVGLSGGVGLPVGYLEMDLSATGGCGPRPPAAASFSVGTAEDTPVSITLLASDDGLPDPPAAMRYLVTSLPAQALSDDGNAHVIVPGDLPYELVGGGNSVTYTPSGGFGGTDSFQFMANDYGIAPDGGDSNTATVDITVGGPVPIYEFLVDDQNPGWTTTGAWAFGQPTGGGSGSGDPLGGYTGVNVYGYNLAGDYPNGMAVEYLTTTAIDCANIVGAELRFQRWLGIESSAYDHASVAVSNNGSTWTTLWNHTGGTFSEAAWTPQTFDISAVADGQATVYIRWAMGTTDGSVTYPGWNVDDVQIWGIDSSVVDCGSLVFTPGDVNPDALVNGDDIQTFVDILLNPAGPWTPEQLCAADLTGEGIVDLADMDAFVAALLN